jgi:SAM-dependent methyltransferase
MTGFLDSHPASVPNPPEAEGMHAEITYRINGTGPALLLLPFFLAPSQWAPAMSELARRFTVVTLGGRHLGGVAALEDRAKAPTYQAMFRTLIDIMAPGPGEAILDVGCGAGSLDRLLAKRLGSANPITAMDTNAFLRSEAATLARAEGVDATIRFVPGDAEKLPFADASFGCAFSVTVLEECDADRAISEMKRVVKPGGRVGVVVRALDMPQWWNLTLPADITGKIVVPPQSVAAKGVADASLYRRMRDGGLVNLTCFPSLITLDRPEGPIWRYREDHVLSLLGSDQMPTWRAARDAAEKAGLLFMAHPMHCAVGIKPV